MASWLEPTFAGAESLLSPRPRTVRVLHSDKELTNIFCSSSVVLDGCVNLGSSQDWQIPPNAGGWADACSADWIISWFCQDGEWLAQLSKVASFTPHGMAKMAVLARVNFESRLIGVGKAYAISLGVQQRIAKGVRGLGDPILALDNSSGWRRKD